MIDAKINTANATRYLNNIAAKQLPYAAANALNNTAFAVLYDEQNALDKYLDRPTPFTKRGYEVVKANRNRLIASVRARQLQGAYLKYQVDGGRRPPKKKAIVVPDKGLRNQYGNMPKGTIKALMRQKSIFSTKPGAKIKGGIYERYKAGGRNRLRFLVAYEPKADYSKRLPFESVAKVTVGKVFKPEFEKQLVRALSTAK